MQSEGGASMLDTVAAKQIDLMGLIEPFTRLKKVAAHEWAGPCPKCGGHDRFKVDPGRGWFCRQCTGSEHWHDQIDFVMFYRGMEFKQALISLIGRTPISQAEIERMTTERQRREVDERENERVDTLKARHDLTASRCWERYHANLAQYPDGRRVWNDRGLDDRWIDYWKLGYDPEHTFYTTGKPTFTSPSLTIPYWRTCYDGKTFTYQVIGLRHRLLMDNPPGGKYRPEIPHLGNNLFVTDLSFQGLGDTVLLVEGEIKAMVTWSALWAGNTLLTPGLDVVGTAGEGVKGTLRDELRTRKMVYICLDPDCYNPPSPCPKTWKPEPERLADDLGRERCKIIRLPGKVDDLLAAGVMDGCELVRLMECA
jgi:hypothetical protein